MTKPWFGGALMAVLLSVAPTLSQKTVVGVTDTEIKIGQSAGFSGPASVYGQISTAESDYFKMINEQGGINDRKINLIAVDDGYSPPKTIEAVRRLIEDEQVAILFQQLQASGADPLYDASTPKFSAMAIRKVADLDWHPLHIANSNGALGPEPEQTSSHERTRRDGKNATNDAGKVRANRPLRHLACRND